MDKTLIMNRFSKARPTYDTEAVIQSKIAKHLAYLVNRFIDINKVERMLEVGCGSGMFSRLFLNNCKPQKVYLNDLCSDHKHSLSDLLSESIYFWEGDAESIRLPDKLDLIVSCSAIQWFENPVNFIRNCQALLNEKGYVAISTFGPQNLREVGTLTGISLRYPTLDNLRLSLSDSFDLIYSHEELQKLTFKTPAEVLRHLKATGVTGISKQRWTKAKLSHFSNQYEKLYQSEEGGITLTYHPVYIILKKKDDGK